MYHVPFSHLLNFRESDRSLDITEFVAFKGVRWRFLLGFRLAEKSVVSTLSQYMRKKCVRKRIWKKVYQASIARLGKKDGS
jgi:hypothetical protein